MADDIKFVFKKTNCNMGMDNGGKKIGLMARGDLTLGDTSYNTICGPWGKGFIPNGSYIVKKYNCVEGSGVVAGMKSPTGRGWFIPIEGGADVRRNGLGIHPDGNLEGTQGCIGIIGTDADRFWDAWLNLELKKRPISLIILGTEKSAGKYSINSSASAGSSE